MRLRRAFSLVELLIVVVVIGVLASLILPRVRAQRDAGRYQVLTGSAQSVMAEMERYFARCQHYPLMPGTPGPRMVRNDPTCADHATLQELLPEGFASLGGEGPLVVEYMRGPGGSWAGAPPTSTSQAYGVWVTTPLLPAAGCRITLNVAVAILPESGHPWSVMAQDGLMRDTKPAIQCFQEVPYPAPVSGGFEAT